MGGREGKRVDSGSPRVRQLVNITSAVTKQGGVDWGRKWGLTITNPSGPPSSDRLSQTRLHLPKVLIYDLSKRFHSWRTWACGECFTITLFLFPFSVSPLLSSPPSPPLSPIPLYWAVSLMHICCLYYGLLVWRPCLVDELLAWSTALFCSQLCPYNVELFCWMNKQIWINEQGHGQICNSLGVSKWRFLSLGIGSIVSDIIKEQIQGSEPWISLWDLYWLIIGNIKIWLDFRESTTYVHSGTVTKRQTTGERHLG